MEFLSKSAYVFMVNAKVRKGVMSDCVQVVFFQGGVIPVNPYKLAEVGGRRKKGGGQWKGVGRMRRGFIK